MIASPCNKVCAIDAQSGLCRGCHRTLDEIARWAGMSELERGEVTRKLPGRRTGSGTAATPQSQGVAASPAYDLCLGQGTRFPMKQSVIHASPAPDDPLAAALKPATPEIMRTVGTRRPPAISGIPTTEALLRAAAHAEAARVLAAVNTTGIAKGIYRFSTAAEASRHSEEALARAIVQNLRARELR